MQTVSKEFISAMEDHPYTARITIDGRDTIQGNAVKEIFFRGGANSSEDNILLGSAFSASVEITLDKDEVSCAIEGRELFVELGIDLPTGTEWLPMGKYIAQNPSEADGILSVSAFDALGAKFDVEYEPIEGFDFNLENGVSSVNFLKAVCARRNVQVDTAGLDGFALKGKPDGFTERQIIGFISALYGGFANIDRLGVLRIQRYAPVDATISPENYYEDGLQKATYRFSPGWMKSYNEAADLTMFVGDMDAQQGINLESIWMTQAILNRLWEEFQGFTYHPVPELSFLGNPLIDPGDILQLRDSSGEIVSVPVMAITHEYDGGILTSISAYGQAKTSDYQGPTRRAVTRSASNAANSAKAYTDSENKKMNQLELLKRLTKEWVDDGIYLTEDGKIGINASSVLVGVLDAALIQVINLIADHLRSVSGSSVMDVSGAVMNMDYDGMTTVHLSNEYGPLPILYMHDYVSGVRMDSCELSPHHIKVGGDSLRPLFVVERKDYINNTSGVQDAWSQLYAGSINPGKKILYTGSVSAGESFKLFESYTSRYDLFAIRLGTDSDKSPATVLAYKQGNTIYGVGGWCGTETLYKELYFVSITISGDTWTLVDAGLHDVYESGGLSDSTRLQLKEVIGVI